MDESILCADDKPDLFGFISKPAKAAAPKRKAKARQSEFDKSVEEPPVDAAEAELLSPENERYLTDRQVGERFNVSRKTIWKWVKQRDDFPAPLSLSPGATRWRLSDLLRFEAGLAAIGRGAS